ncbi:MAG TPA: hypothetical protein VJK72_05085 [Candidatus Nanoarchaeia archaeon]|nr:hypothetical protein [Candidatus Nanoarchaeia archaeon]
MKTIHIVIIFFLFISGCASEVRESTVDKTKEYESPSQQSPSIANVPSTAIKTIQGPGYAEVVDASNGIAAWLSRDKIVQVINIDKPQSPSLVKTLSSPGFTESVHSDDKYIYVADSKEFQVRTSDDNKPSATFRLDGFWPEVFTVKNNNAFIVSGDKMMILDVENNIQKVSEMALTGLAPSDIIVKDDYAYVVQTLGGLNIIDVHDPQQPKSVKVIPFESHTLGFKIKDNYGYLGRITSLNPGKDYEFTSLFEIIDLTNPTAARVIGSVEVPTNIKGLDINGNYAYVIGGTYPYRLSVIDISSPASPKLLPPTDSFTNAEFQDILVEDGYAYITDGMSGLKVLDVSNPMQPQQIKELNLGGRAFKIQKFSNLLYMNVEQKYFNIAAAEKLVYTETYTSSYPNPSVVVHDDKIFVKTSEFKMYDITDQSHPKKINKNSVEVDSIQVQGNYLYSTIGEIGLLVFDISDPTIKPVSTTAFQTGIPRDVSVDGTWAVSVTNIPYSISVLDISNPKIPVPKDSHLYERYPDDIFVKDNQVYVARGMDGLDILKINDDGSLKLLKNIKKERYTHDVAVEANTAVVVREGLDIYDVRDPSHEVFQQHITTAGEAVDAAIDGDFIYVADGYAGLSIVPWRSE